MSGLSRLQKQLREVQDTLEELSVPESESESHGQQWEELIVGLHERLGDMKEGCETFRRKLNDKDPVTGNPRFGPATATKIQEMLALHDKLSSDICPLVLIARNKLEVEKQEKQGDDRKLSEDEAAAERIQQQRIYKHHPTPAPMVPLNIFRPNLEVLTTSVDNVESVQVTEEDQLLKEKAESVRTRKRTQAELEALERCKENALLRSVADSLNNGKLNRQDDRIGSTELSNHLWPYLLALEQAAKDAEQQQVSEFGMIIETADEAMAVAFKCLKGILGNISSHPDDEKLRRIRINHPAIKERLTKFGVAAVMVLVALGFKAKAVMASGNPIPDEDFEDGEEESKGEEQKRKEDVGRDTVEKEVKNALDADGSRLTGRLTLMLAMTEPPTETAAGREAWKVWFDDLNESMDVIEQFRNRKSSTES